MPNKTTQITIKITEQEKQAWRAAAAENNETTHAWCRIILNVASGASALNKHLKLIANEATR